jgi:hypothetical protein
VREQREVLEHHAELAPARRQVRHVPAVDHDAARVGPHVAGERPERRRLPAARRAEKCQELPSAHHQVEPVVREDRPVTRRDAAELDHRIRHAPLKPPTRRSGRARRWTSADEGDGATMRTAIALVISQ